VKPAANVRKREDAEAFASPPREPLERFASLAGRTAYRMPAAGRATGDRIDDCDLAHAMAAGDDELGKALAMAVILQRLDFWPAISRLCMDRLRVQALACRTLAQHLDGGKVFRLRLVAVDAFRDLIFPAHRPSRRSAAQRLRMDERAYRTLHRFVSGAFEAAANTAAADALRYLLGDHRAPPPSP